MDLNEISDKAYLVGGAVRDILRGRPSNDRDYLVVGCTPSQMMAAGFKQVGEAFAVYLHPVTGEEYALARIERKAGMGHTAFETDVAPTVSLEDDLIRRDLTCNAIAMRHGAIIDPYNGRSDIECGILRHTSAAFSEDPLRVLRVARFAATLGWTIAPETIDLCREIAASGELDALSPERVAAELKKALVGTRPSLFFEALLAMNALKTFFPEVQALMGQTHDPRHHAEGDAYVHTMMVLDAAAPDVLVRFGALCHDLGKGLTAPELLPRHHGHEEAGVAPAEALSERLKLSNAMRHVGSKAARYHAHVHKIFELTPKTLVKVCLDLGRAELVPEIAALVALVAAADHAGRLTAAPRGPYPNGEAFVSAMKAIAAVKLGAIATPEDIAEMTIDRRKQMIHRRRIDAARTAMRAFG